MAVDDPVAAAEALIAAGRPARAAALLRHRLARGRGGALMRVALVDALIAAGDGDGALREAREAVSLNPDLPAALVALGEALLAAARLPAAIAELQRALRRDPGNARAALLVGRAWLEAGEADRALEILLAQDPDAVPDLAGLIARARAMKGASRCDPGYVRHLFDQFSADYDMRMRGPLSYAAPEILRALADLVMPVRANLNVLDLGCGTGLAGEAFRPLARRLDGVDLSPAMLARARARNIYDHLATGDIETALGHEVYDLALAADTLVYLGDLSPVFAAVRARLSTDGTTGGWFLFTVEVKEGAGFELGEKRRWRHSADYLRQAAAAAGFQVAGLVSAAPRREAGRPVAGLAAALSAV